MVKNDIPVYEIISGAAIAFAALLLIIPGFATDLFGLILIFPLTRKILMNAFSKKYSKGVKRKNFIVKKSLFKEFYSRYNKELKEGNLKKNTLSIYYLIGKK